MHEIILNNQQITRIADDGLNNLVKELRRQERDILFPEFIFIINLIKKVLF